MTQKKKSGNWLKRVFDGLFPEPDVDPVPGRLVVAPPKESRRQVRSYLEVPIVFQSGGEGVEATTFDISPQGLYVRTTRLPKVGARLPAEFVLPSGHRIHCHLLVAWINDYNALKVIINRPPGFGAALEEIRLEDQEAISRAIASSSI
jgi:hypothetical protein